MAAATSNVSIGEMYLANANTYEDRAKSTMRVGGGGQYHHSSKSVIHSRVYNHHEARQADHGPALQSLYEHSAMGALHSSDERVDAPRCHEQTREAVQSDILSALSDGGGSQGLVWLTGPAGGGKTAIIGTVCDRLNTCGRVAAAFYFSSHKGSVERKSKRYFVTTLAYQMQNHPVLGEYISDSMFSAIRRHPGIFEMDLKTQMEELILKPFRAAHIAISSAERGPWVVAADGIDECGEGDGRSREKDQVEVLCCLLHAMQDVAFPCRIIVASRPERCIRRFFEESAAPRFVEILLCNNYSPDTDIELYFRSSFSHLCRVHGYDASAWPNEQDIEKLVTNASGQFIYAATAIRFIDSPPSLPKDQLEVILRLKPQAKSGPFHALDALYIAILESSPSPAEAVLWLRAIMHCQHRDHNYPLPAQDLQPSAWTINRLFESVEGQARMVLGIPSLLYVQGDTDNDYSKFSSLLLRRDDLHRSDDHSHSHQHAPTLDQCGHYAFYHKSFLDFLQDPKRSQAAFPNAASAKVDSWIWERISKTLELDRPVIQLPSFDLDVFRSCLLFLMVKEFRLSGGRMKLSSHALSQIDPMNWISVIRSGPSDSVPLTLNALSAMFHKECRFYRSCTVGCKRWRKVRLSHGPVQRKSRTTRLSRILDRV